MHHPRGASKGKAEDRGIGAVLVIALPAADGRCAAPAIKPERRFVAVLHFEKQPLRAAARKADGRLKQGPAETLVAAGGATPKVRISASSSAFRAIRRPPTTPEAVGDRADQAERLGRQELRHCGRVPGPRNTAVKGGQDPSIERSCLAHGELDAISTASLLRLRLASGGRK